VPITGPTVTRRQLGRRLRALRERAGMTMPDVTDSKLGFSRAKLSRIEAGTVAVKTPDVWALCRIYNADAKTTDALAGLAAGTGDQNWWENYPDAMGAGVALYIGLEEAADELRSYESELVHGLFQTPDYFRAVCHAARPNPGETAVERSVSLRTERQRAVLGRGNPPQITAILNAAVLARLVGGPKVMGAQVRHLRALAALDHVDIRVLPWEAGAHAAMAGSFAILDFINPDDPSVVHADTYSGARYEEKPDLVDEYREVFSAIRKYAKPIEE
jgi:transcriptional regulator with XRE-family HTH domain